MRRLQAIALAAVLVVATLALAGCAQWFENPAKGANDAIVRANAHLKKAATIASQVTSDAAALDSIPYTKAGATAALKTSASLKATLASEKTELEAAKAEMDSIAKLDVGAEFKKYATLESAAIATRITMVDANSRLYLAMDQLYTGLKSGKANVDPQQISTVIDSIKSEIASLTYEAAKQDKAAADYFTANTLGG
jgi:hypothetical protein